MMSRTLCAFASLLLVLSAGCVETTEVAVSSSQNVDFVKDVYESNLPVLVDFGASWCGPCRELAPILHELENEYTGRLKIITIDVDEQRALAREHNIHSLPTMILFQEGAPVDTRIGFMNKAAIVQWIDSTVDFNRSSAPPEPQPSAASAGDVGV